MKYPDLSKAGLISIDIETYDPELKEKGPGVYRKDGNVLGVGLATPDGFAEYYDIGHKGIDPELKRKNLAYIKEQLEHDVPKLTANGEYDFDWLCNDDRIGLKLVNMIHDVQIAEPLIDENSFSFSLDTLGMKYLNRKKHKTELEDWCSKHGLKGDPRQHLYLVPYELARPYVLEDIRMPLEIFEKQHRILEQENLLPIYEIEVGLLPLLLQMRKTGIRLHKQRVEENMMRIHTALQYQQKEMDRKYGKFNFRSSSQIASLMDRLGIDYPLNEPTEKMKAKGITVGNPNLDAKTLSGMGIPLTEDILQARTLAILLNTFFLNSFTYSSVNGRLHCEFPRLRKDDAGTVSGRFSSRNPNLQQIPAKDKLVKFPDGTEQEIAELCRACFLPEPGHLLGKTDYSQIEYRLIAHYARGEKSELVRKAYNENPKTDYHQMVMDWTGLHRKEAKVLNFGTSYFMGIEKQKRQFGWTDEQAEMFNERYKKEVPFVFETRSHVAQVAKRRGYITTILGRRARISEWHRKYKKEYQFFNRLIQGSAADILKKAMYDCYRAGIYEVLIPHLTVHDELVNSVPPTKVGLEAYREQKHIMETGVKLRVPLIADAEIGPDWYNVSETDFNNMEKYYAK